MSSALPIREHSLAKQAAMQIVAGGSAGMLLDFVAVFNLKFFIFLKIFYWKKIFFSWLGFWSPHWSGFFQKMFIMTFVERGQIKGRTALSNIAQGCNIATI